MSHSSARVLELAEFEKVLREHCEVLNQQVLALEKGRQEDQLAITSLTTDQNRSHAQLQEKTDDQARMDMEMAWLKADLAQEIERGLQPVGKRGQALSQMVVGDHLVCDLIPSPSSPGTSTWGTFRSSMEGQATTSAPPIPMPSSSEEYQMQEECWRIWEKDLKACLATKMTLIFQRGFMGVVQQCISREYLIPKVDEKTLDVVATLMNNPPEDFEL